MLRRTAAPASCLPQHLVRLVHRWIMLLPPAGPPVSLHPASGTSHEHANAPIQGIQGPGTIWTGTQLVVWGGVPAEGNDLPAGAGMIWTAPDADTEVSTDTTMPETSGEPVPSSWTGPGMADLPPSGIAVAEDGELVLHDFDGNELACDDRTGGRAAAEQQRPHAGRRPPG